MSGVWDVDFEWDRQLVPPADTLVNVTISATDDSGTTSVIVAFTVEGAGVVEPAPTVAGLPATVNIEVGQVAQYNLIVSPSNASLTPTVDISSSIATYAVTDRQSPATIGAFVRERRLTVLGGGIGSRTVTFTVASGGQSTTYDVRITVTAAGTVTLETARISGLTSGFSVRVGASSTDSFTVEPADATVTATSDDTGVATATMVDDAGSTRSVRVTGVAAGTTTLTVEVTSGTSSDSDTASITVTTRPPPPPIRDDPPSFSGLDSAYTFPLVLNNPDYTDNFTVSDATSVSVSSITGPGRFGITASVASRGGDDYRLTVVQSGIPGTDTSTTVTIRARGPGGTTDAEVTISETGLG